MAHYKRMYNELWDGAEKAMELINALEIEEALNTLKSALLRAESIRIATGISAADHDEMDARNNAFVEMNKK